MNRIIVFDFDGTLITCETKHKFALHSILCAMDKNNIISIDDWWKLKIKGYSTEQALVELGFINAQLTSRIWINIIEHFSWCYLDKPFEDSLSSLEFLKNKLNLNIIILSSRKSSLQVKQAIMRFGFDKYINDIIVVNPKQGLEEKIFHLKRIKPLIFIGDSELDYKAAKESKVRFVALSRGQRSYEFLKSFTDLHIEPDLKFLINLNLISNLSA